MAKYVRKSVLQIVLILLGVTYQANAQCTFTTGVPYFQSFNTITTASPLPQCWSVSNPSTCLTFTSTAQAAFFSNPGGLNHFWTNGIYLNAGVVYSASLIYYAQNNFSGSWLNLSLLYGTSQTSLGLNGIASTSSFPNNILGSFGGTFTPASSGIYYFAIRSSSSGGAVGTNLYFDNFAITIPCNLNAPPVLASPSSTAVCLGDTLYMNAQGADSYTWNTGSSAQSFSVLLGTNANFYVTGTSTLTGCSATSSVNILVNPSPIMSIFASTTQVCTGSTLVLAAFGSPNFIWSTGSNNSTVVVNPVATTVYSLSGWNAFGCTGMATLQINTLPLPTLSVTPSKTPICFGEFGELYATGAQSYTWSSSIGASGTATINFLATAHAIFQVYGAGANGCVGTTSLAVNLSSCNGISEAQAVPLNFNIAPNPASGRFLVSTSDGESIQQVEVFDYSGKKCWSAESTEDALTTQQVELPQGIYTVVVTTQKGKGRKIVLVK